MQNISSTALLKDTILILETEQKIEERLLKEQFYTTYERLKPANLLRSMIQDITTAPYLVDHIISMAVGLATGYLTKKIVVGTSVNIIWKFLGILMQMGVTYTLAERPDTIKSIEEFI
jgi:hypothetical protein